MSIKVAINGYGTIGKRVADAVSRQDDMQIIGVSKTKPSFEAFAAQENNYPLFVAKAEQESAFNEAGIPIAGTVADMLADADIVVDCTPGKLGVNNKEMYSNAGVKAIWQGGEKHEPIGKSFNALTNYDDSYGADFVRVVSCNTTGLARTLYPLEVNWGVDNVKAVMVRRSADPGDSKRGPINSIEPVLNVPSHHGPDVKTVIKGMNIQTMAVKVPTTLMHVHCNIVQMKNIPDDVNSILEVWENTPRVALVDGVFNTSSTSVKSMPGTAEIMEFARGLGRDFSDLNEIAVWKDGVHLVDGLLYYYQAIHQESDVIPENIDAIRAMCELEKDNMKSMLKTNQALGIN